jgi:hypothetical protein
VTVSTEPEVTNPPAPASAADSGVEIEFRDIYRVRVRADFDAQVLRRVLDCLGRAEGARETRAGGGQTCASGWRSGAPTCGAV